MDRPEIIANKGDETFAEHFVNVGIEKGKLEGADQERKKNEALNTKRAEFLRSQNESDEVISAMLALK